MIVFSLVSWLALYLILRTQGIHPFNPQGFHSGTWDVSFNTASSFVTNTNWQFYGGETTLSNFTQMAGLAVQNFVSAAVGIAVLVAVIRGISRRSASTLGNFWPDLTRTLLYILLPISRRRRPPPGLAGRHPDAVAEPRLHRRSRAPTVDARGRPGRLAGGHQGARHERRRLLQRQLRDAVREPQRHHELPRDAPHPHHPRRPDGHVRPDGRQPPSGLGAATSRCSRCSSSASRSCTPRRRTARSRRARGGHRRRQPRGQGDPLRRHQLGAVERDHDRHVVRRRERRARLADRHRRRDPDVEHDGRRGRLRRRRLGPLRDVAVRPARGLHRRPDGGPHARVPRQEDRGARGEARR